MYLYGYYDNKNQKLCVYLLKAIIMSSKHSNFNNIVESIYNLPLEFKEELRVLLEHNIADVRRNEISVNYKTALKEQASGKLKFSSSISDLKKNL